MANLKQWMKVASVPEQEQLAKAVGSHRLSLYQFAVEEGKSYKRHIRAKLAAALEKASEVMHNMTDGRLPVMKREELADECRDCPYARRFCGQEKV